MSSSTSSLRFMGLNLTPSTSGRNVVTFYWACLTGILLSTFTPQLQPYLLSEFLHIPTSEQGLISGKLSFWGEVAIILSCGVWGALSDKIGRRPVMALGYAIITLGVLLYPYATSYNGLLVARLAFGVGIGAFSVIIITLIADYFEDESRGKATGMLGVFNGLGALTTVMLLIQLPQYFQSTGMDSREAGFATYYVVAAMTAVTALIMWLGLKKKDINAVPHEGNLLQIAQAGLRAGRDPGIALAYGAAFISRANLAVVGTFFTLWLANYGSDVLNMDRAAALAKAGIILAIVQSIALFSAPIFGILTDKINRVDALLLTMLFAFIGYGGTYFVTDPFGIGMITCGVFIGMSEVGCVITSAVLISQQSPKKIRGAVIGFFNLSGAVGIMVASIAGGYLFDSWKPAGAFVFVGMAALIVLCWGLLVRHKIKPPEENI
ncbi:MAG: MFS transporter [Pseudomonadales bacterium]